MPAEEYASVRALKEQRAVHNVETGVVKEDGNVIWVSVSAVPVTFPDWKVVVVTSDITERKRAEEQIQNLARFPSENPNPVLRINQDGRIMYANEASLPLLRQWETAVGRACPDRWRSSIDQALAGKNVEVEVDLGEQIISFVVVGVPQAGYINLYGRDITERKQAEAAMRKSEAELHALFAAMKDVVFVTDRDGRYIKIAPTDPGGLVKPPAELIGKTMADVMPKARAREFVAYIRSVLETQQTMQVEYPLTISGQVAWFSASISPMEQDTVIWVARDITARKRAETERQVLLDIMQGSAAAQNLQEFLLLIHHSISTVIDAENISVVFHRKNTGLFEEIYKLDKFDLPMPPSKLEKSITSYVFRTAEPLLLTQAGFDELVAQGEVELVGTPSACWLGAPIKTPVETIGVISVQNYEDANCYTKRDLEFLSFVAAQVSQAIERKRAEEVLRASEERFRSILDNIEDGYYEVDTAGNLTFFNPALVRILGRPANELMGMNYRLYMTPEGGKAVFQTFNRVFRTGIPEQAFDWELVRPDGTHRSVEVSVSLIKAADGSIKGFRGIVRDIAERKQVEEAEHEQRALAEALCDTATALSSTLHLDEVLDRILTNVERVMPCDSANVMLVESGVASFACHRGYADRGLEESTRSLRFTLDDTATLHHMVETGKPLIIPDTQNYPQWVDVPETRWIRSYAGVPIRVKEETVGFLNLDNATPGFFTPAHAERLKSFTAQAAVAIENAWLYEDVRDSCAVQLRTLEELDKTTLQLRERVEQMVMLMETNRAITENISLKETLERILLYARKIVPVSECSMTLVDEMSGDLVVQTSTDGETGLRINPADPSAVGCVMATKQILVEENVSANPIFNKQFVQRYRIKSGLVVPIIYKDRTIGALAFGITQGRRAFSDIEEMMAQAFAHQAAIAIENSRLYEEIQTRRRYLETMLQVNATLRSTLPLNEVLSTITYGTGETLGYVGSLILLPDATGERLILAAAWGGRFLETAIRFTKEEVNLFNLPLTARENPIARAYLSGEIQSWSKALERIVVGIEPAISPKLASLIELARGAKLAACIPLLVEEKKVGVLVIFSPREQLLDEEHVMLLGLANQAGLAITSARLFEEVRAGRERLQTLSRRLVEVQEAERRHIARELHDEIGQALTGLKLALEISALSSAETVKTRLDEAKTLISEVLARVRELSLDLRPGMLDDLGLLPALLWHFERYTAQTGIQVDFKYTGLQGQRFLPEVETAAYRIVQEALTNVARHAGVGLTAIRLRASQDTLGVQIEDQGIGFDSEAALASGGSSGLAGMCERAVLLGGQLTVESTPGAGTRVVAELPLAEQLERREKER